MNTTMSIRPMESITDTRDGITVTLWELRALEWAWKATMPGGRVMLGIEIGNALQVLEQIYKSIRGNHANTD